ncbi:hypothetical protein JZ751_000737 [Albula glossodonta]|uniref:Uncharacterized protein n=1 Tax=Albula glossodonta TaxID=121402 RepID=A0A8T2PX29_9TELE|nr:hypothetical protein JZ751_000737 [Albula glossodonta]
MDGWLYLWISCTNYHPEIELKLICDWLVHHKHFLFELCEIIHAAIALPTQCAHLPTREMVFLGSGLILFTAFLVEKKPERPKPTCPPQTDGSGAEEIVITDGTFELTRSLYLANLTYTLMILKSVAYFAVASLLAYKRS